jgi:hypothetical protein
VSDGVKIRGCYCYTLEFVAERYWEICMNMDMNMGMGMVGV